MIALRSPIYVIVDYPGSSPEGAYAIAGAAVGGGAGMIQFRTKQRLSDRETEALRGLAARCRQAAVPLVVNDFVALAHQAAADGVHVGLSDESVADARQALGAEAVVGATTPTVDLALQAAASGASYVAVGAMYPSLTKPEKPVLGPGRLHAVAEAVSLPVCGIGGITAQHVPELLAAGADLLAVISAVSAASDPLEAVRELVRACDG